MESRCPECNGHVIIKHGKNGEFYGCENFPSCRFSAPIQDCTGKDGFDVNLWRELQESNETAGFCAALLNN